MSTSGSSRFGKRRVILASMMISTMLLYISSYLILSRRGMAEARAYGAKKFYFSSPYHGGSEGLHMFFYRLYKPALIIDKQLGGRGMEPGSWPLSLASEGK